MQHGQLSMFTAYTKHQTWSRNFAASRDFFKIHSDLVKQEHVATLLKAPTSSKFTAVCLCLPSKYRFCQPTPHLSSHWLISALGKMKIGIGCDWTTKIP
jgi:hypothetical protein